VRLLYVTDRPAIGSDRLLAVLAALSDAAELAVSLREREASDRAVLALAGAARERLGPRVSLFLHRRLDLALAAAADGVQLPENGLSVARARAAAPRGLRIGVSTHSPAAAAAAIEGGADRVLLGPIFDTPGKRAFGPPLGAAALGELPRTREHGAEVFAIGGMEERRLDELEPWRDRISGVAAIRMVQEAPDPREVAARIAAR
jgi:thiamine-phosphate pyrophosphorylase